VRWVAIGVVLGSAHAAAAAVGDWQLNELVSAAPNGDAAARYVELYANADACWFPSTRLDVYDAGGQRTGSIAPFLTTTCFPSGTYLVVGTAAAGATFGFTPDAVGLPPLPTGAGQLCFASSSTDYDCVRWGAISVPVHDFLGATDDTSALAPPRGIALARTQVTHVVANDWTLEAPTPRAVNDGAPYVPPDAGLGPPDAAPPPDAQVTDAAPPDAVVDARPPRDAAPLPPDAPAHTYLSLDPGGGACTCRSTSAGGAIPIAIALLALVRPADRRLTRRRAKTGA
jgi:hypothetical protein